jgi:hypothetical protein
VGGVERQRRGWRRALRKRLVLLLLYSKEGALEGLSLREGALEGLLPLIGVGGVDDAVTLLGRRTEL